jgi:hypothetical protein
MANSSLAHSPNSSFEQKNKSGSFFNDNKSSKTNKMNGNIELSNAINEKNKIELS